MKRPPEDDQRNFAFESEIQIGFERDMRERPFVYTELVKLAKLAQSRGWKHYGIGSLYEVLRWHRHIEYGPDEDFKLNNNFRSRYARKIMDDNPELRDFFETRKLTSD
jgi:hypothetical protein